MNPSGEYVSVTVGGEVCKAFIPNPLPPTPAINLDTADYDLMEKANRALGRLDGISSIIPDPWFFLYFYVRKEALLSSQIEGIQSSLAELLLFEKHHSIPERMDDAVEVSNYVAALTDGLKQIEDDGLPISNRLICNVHRTLLREGRGSQYRPGEFKKNQNWIGGSKASQATFIPAPPHHVEDCMHNLERYINNEFGPQPVLIKAAVAHAQFETIHPFMDGNGRTGRILIPLLLFAEDVLKLPLLYLSLFFKQNRREYYERLQQVRLESDWVGWIRFFLQGVYESSQQAVSTANRIVSLGESDRKRIETSGGQRVGNCLRIHHHFQNHVMASIASMKSKIDLSDQTIRSGVAVLMEMGMIQEITGQKRNKHFVYSELYNLLSEGTEPLPPS